MTDETHHSSRAPGRPRPLGAVYFAALAVAVWALSLFTNGYVLLGDMVFTPAMHPPTSLLGPGHGTMDVTLVYNLAWLVSRVIGAVLLQKAILFLIVFLAGYLMYRNVPASRQWSRLFAGTLYAINPFTYTRLLMGQWGFLLGYALLPVVFASVVKTVRKPTPGRCAVTSLWLAGTALLSLHAGALALLVAVFVAVFELVKRPGAWRAVVAVVSVLLLFVLLSSFWILPLLERNGQAESIGKADLTFFATRSTSHAGIAVSVIGMYGYWKTQLDSLMPRKYVPLWFIFGFLLLLLALYGYLGYHAEPGRGRSLGALGLLMIVGFFLALGSRAWVTGGLFSWLYNNVVALRIFREPQKFVALIVFGYCVIGATGTDRFLSRRQALEPERPKRRINRLAVLPLILIALTCFYSFRMFGGLWGQAKAVSYPSSWSDAQRILQKDSSDWAALYLPPYWYMRFDFTKSDNTITSPMPFYFKNRYVMLTPLGVGPFVLDQQPVDRYVTAALDSGRTRGNLGAMLAPLDVKYVVMSLNQASVGFRFVEEQKDLVEVARWDDLVLLRNRVPVSRLTLAGGSGTYTTWEALGGFAKGGNLLGSILLGGTRNLVPDTTGTPAPETAVSAVRVEASLPPARNKATALLFAEPFSRYWTMNGSPSKENLGMTSAFSVPSGAASVKVSYLNPWLVIGYIISGAAIILCLLLLILNSIAAGRKPEESVGDHAKLVP